MIKNWISAFRLRTLPLALSSILLGALMSASNEGYDILITVLCILTTVCLQVLSNLANDYGDSVNGADHAERKGPSRTVQSGAISLKAMRNAIILFVVFSLVSGSSLLLYVFGLESIKLFSFFFVIGVLSIIAAIKYTAGKKPYGYAGLGDISVFLFFGIVGVLGTYYLHAKVINLNLLFPACSIGLFSVGVLNINNIRDIESDKLAGKKSIPVRLGQRNARIYHWSLLVVGILCAFIYVSLNYQYISQFLFVISIIPLTLVGVGVWKNKEVETIDPYLKKMALSTLLFAITFGLGNLLCI